MKLLIETIESTEIITEGEGNDRRHFIHGIFLQAGIKNKNGRVYPPSVMENEVNRYIKEKVSRNCAYGELGHPTDKNPSISLDRVSHIIKELKRDGNNWIGKAQLINEGMGKIAIGLLNAGANLGVSSRALGSTKNVGGITEVQPDFHIMTAADIVANPSAPDAYVQGLMEDAEWIWDNGVLREQKLVRERARRAGRRRARGGRKNARGRAALRGRRSPESAGWPK